MFGLAAGATGRGYPKVGGASVEVDNEFLRRGANRNSAGPLLLILIGELLGLTRLEAGLDRRGEGRNGRDVRVLRVIMNTDPFVDGNQVTTILAVRRTDVSTCLTQEAVERTSAS